MNQSNQLTNYLTIDVEDYFQVSAFEDIISPDDWESYESRVESNTQTILNILDSNNIKATFFIVGWIAERNIKLVKEIVQKGHQIGCHSYLHRKVYDLTPDEFRNDTKKAKTILEKITGTEITGYRAPSYSITKKSLWALDILAELGFKYDSSIFPIMHDTYGIPDAPRYPFQWDLTKEQPKYPKPTSKPINQQTNKPTNQLTEYPISTARFLGLNIPAAGGGYFRLFPYWFTRMLLRKTNKQDNQPFIFYIHLWEVDPNQPRMKNARPFSKFRHYNNFDKTVLRFIQLLKNFKFRNR